jgi:hypothetical protein
LCKTENEKFEYTQGMKKCAHSEEQIHWMATAEQGEEKIK